MRGRLKSPKFQVKGSIPDDLVEPIQNAFRAGQSVDSLAYIFNATALAVEEVIRQSMDHSVSRSTTQGEG